LHAEAPTTLVPAPEVHRTVFVDNVDAEATVAIESEAVMVNNEVSKDSRRILILERPMNIPLYL
jgi:hypothetical protein